ncbi:TPA: hypothetical protein ACH6H0_001449 [Campylobacter jejuni]|uniref:hypothetical protein n=1 Tax=Campylobacter jejuni TaxID=197 RepID=UPI0020435D9D|nr:hypothetical protein [Campylobacter jejuni]
MNINSRIIGDFWEYHREFADFIIKNTSLPPPKKKCIRDRCGGHGKFLQNCLSLADKIDYS